MNLLVLGGTKFLGRATVEAALARGHEVTLFNRGQTNADLFPETEKLRGDRESDLSALTGRTWDAVVDPSGYVPGVVRASAEKLAESVGFYVFVSSLSAYADRSKAMVEGDALEELGDMPDDRLLEDFSNYGALKALAEQVVAETFPQTHANVRPGLIVGPHDPTGRFTYWPHRVARGGRVAAPAPPEDRVQFIDVRDLANWIVGLCERGEGGELNAVTKASAGPTCWRLVATSRAPTRASSGSTGSSFSTRASSNGWAYRSGSRTRPTRGSTAPTSPGRRRPASHTARLRRLRSDTRARRDDRRRGLSPARGRPPRSLGRPVTSRRWRGSTSCTTNRSAFGTSTRWGT